MVRALVIDDSAVFRRLITQMLEEDGTIEVVGAASDPLIARRKIKMLNPDVLTLDIEMDRMDGITFLRNLMRLRPMPVVMVSSFVSEHADVTLEALAIGAVDFMPKPKMSRERQFRSQAKLLREKVRAAANSRPFPTYSVDVSETSSPRFGSSAAVDGGDEWLIAVGASTGGTGAVGEVLANLPASVPGIVIAQHIPRAFSESFARRLSSRSALEVREARHRQPISRGCAYVAPGGVNLTVERHGAGYRCALDSIAAPGPDSSNPLRPSVDALFQSVAREAQASAIGVLLTGMGTDGADGLLAMRERGAFTIAQDEASSVVWGMPGAAVRRNAACAVAPKSQIASEAIAELTRRLSAGTHRRPAEVIEQSGNSADTGCREGIRTVEENR